jgi:23S rRNA pseudouridine1911/1915/1917 synthase
MTSGLVALARNPRGEDRWREAEQARAIGKYYLALVEGNMPHPLRLSRALDTAGRRVSRVLQSAHPDPGRHTWVVPLAGRAGPKGGQTLALCRIHLGARHQIRAHLGAAGHPLCGDALYGGRSGLTPLLHHIWLDMPDFSVFCPPAWDDPALPLLSAEIIAKLWPPATAFREV